MNGLYVRVWHLAFIAVALTSFLSGSLASAETAGLRIGNAKQLAVFPWDPFNPEKILPDTAISTFTAGDHVAIKACRGEREPASFVIHPAEDLDDITIVASELTGVNGATIPAAAVDVRLVKCWYQAGKGTIRTTRERVLTPELLLHDDRLVKVDDGKRANYLRVTVDGREQYVDISSEGAAPPSQALFDDAPALKPFALMANQNKQVWVTLHIPQDAASGSYFGMLEVRVAGTPVAGVGFHLEVLPFTLAKPILDYGLYYRGVLRQHVVLKVGPEDKNSHQYRADLKNMSDHGIQYPTVYQHANDSLLDAALSIRNEFPFRKDRLFTLGTTTGNGTDPQGLQRLNTSLDIWDKHSAKHGYSSVYIYGVDEAVGDKLIVQRPSWEVVHKRRMKVFAAVYEGAVKLVGEVLDQPILSGYKPQEVERWHAHGKRVYSYGNPQVGIEDPALYRRNYGFQLWLGGYDGCMPYAYQHGFGEIWNDFDHAEFRDHVFAYPTRTGVIDTVQWEGFREAVDDIRYLSTAIAHSGSDAVRLKADLAVRLSNPSIPMSHIRSWLIERMILTKRAIPGNGS